MACPCRDLKAENVLLHQQGHWVLCDFGSTTTFAGVYESTNAIMAAEEIIRKYTTPAYRAPEVCDPVTLGMSVLLDRHQLVPARICAAALL